MYLQEPGKSPPEVDPRYPSDPQPNITPREIPMPGGDRPMEVPMPGTPNEMPNAAPPEFQPPKY